MLPEINRKLNNLIQIGTVVETKSDKGLALARVDIDGRVTDFLPVFLFNNDFIKVWIPVRVKQQVVVLSPFGNADFGVILPAIYNVGNKEPAGANANNVIVEIGSVRIETDGQSVDISAPVSVNLNTPVVNMSGDLVVTGNITDSRGDLTGHTHSTTDGATANPR